MSCDCPSTTDLERYRVYQLLKLVELVVGIVALVVSIGTALGVL